MIVRNVNIWLVRTCSNTSWRASKAHILTQATAPAPVNSVAAISLTGGVCSAVSSCAAALHCGDRCCCLRASLACRKRWSDGRLSWQWCRWFKREGAAELTPQLVFACVYMAVMLTVSDVRAPCTRPPDVRARTRQIEFILGRWSRKRCPRIYCNSQVACMKTQVLRDTAPSG